MSMISKMIGAGTLLYILGTTSCYCGELKVINSSKSCVRAYFNNHIKHYIDIHSGEKKIILPYGSEFQDVSFTKFHSNKPCGGTGIYFFKANSGGNKNKSYIEVVQNGVVYG